MKPFKRRTDVGWSQRPRERRYDNVIISAFVVCQGQAFI